MNTQILNQFYPQSHSRPEFMSRSASQQQSKGDVGQAEAPDDGLNIQPVTPKSSQQVLNQRILEALNREIASTGAPAVQSLDASEFTPQKVADRILNFINQAATLANLNDPTGEAGKRVLEQGRAGVEQGFADAKDILEGLGVYNGKIKEDAEQTYNLIQQGLDGNTAAVAANSNSPVQATAGRSLSLQTSSISRNESTELNIETSDGDKVTIRLVNSASSSSAQLSASGDGFSLNGVSSQSSQMSGYEIQVEGNLDEGERAAISDLVGKIDQLASDFFGGNVETAFSKAMDLGFNSEELANFSLNLSYSEERAVSAYQQTSTGGSDVQGQGQEQAPGLNQLLQQASDFLNRFQALLEDDTAQRTFKNPGEAVRDIFTEMVNARKEDRGDDPKEIKQSGHNLRDFLQALMESAKAKKDSEVGAIAPSTETEESASEEAGETVEEAATVS